MLHINFTIEDLVKTRFAYSPLWETIASYHVIRQPDCFPLHKPWIQEALHALKGIDLSILEVFYSPESPYPHHFFTPTLTHPFNNIETELEHLAHTSLDNIQEELSTLLQNANSDFSVSWYKSIENFLLYPQATLNQLIELLWIYWRRSLAPHWIKLQMHLEADIAYRSKTFAYFGPECVFAGLHPHLHYANRRLKLENCDKAIHEIDLSGKGLLLIPSIFIQQTSMLAPPWQRTLQYKARGIGNLWFTEESNPSIKLQKLLGETRAKIIQQLVSPATTQQLAAIFHLSASAISQHLSWLRETGFVISQRKGKYVYYRLSTMAEMMLEFHKK